MSRDVVALALKSGWDYAKADDVALGEVLAGHGVELHHINRPVLMEPHAVLDSDTSVFMWRCRGSGKERNDVEIMLELHRTLSSEAGAA